MGRKSRNLLTLAVVVMIIATVTLTGCTTPAPQAEKTTIVFAVGGASNEIDFWHKIIDDFEAKNPNIKVDLLLQPMDTGPRMQTLVTPLSGKSPHLTCF